MNAMVRPVRVLFGRGLIEQSAVERVAKALFVSGLLWLAIWWATG